MKHFFLFFVFLSYFFCAVLRSSPVLIPESTGFKKPVQVLFAPRDNRAYYVVQQTGEVFRISKDQTGKKKKTLFADFSSLSHKGTGEEGLLSIAFPPDFNLKRPSFFYANYTGGRPSYTYLVRVPVRNGRGTLLRKRTLIRFRQPYRNHNGGMILFGPDRMLYMATGDGGSAGDPLNAGQNPSVFLGKILRIDVLKAGRKPYSIPFDNPFVGKKGFLPEIYAWGLRNPWRFSFDRETKALYAADVGQNRQEEVNLIVSGGNYGWRIREGYLCYKPYFIRGKKKKSCLKAGLKEPIHAYNHSKGSSITGGYVYRGNLLKSYKGHYFFADYISQKLWALPLNRRTGKASGKPKRLLSSIGFISSFGESPDGELYLCDHQKGKIYSLQNSSSSLPPPSRPR